MRLLILGGTTEGSALARSLVAKPGVSAVLSLAGRTARPSPAPIPVRTGGFGGADGLAAYLANEAIDTVVDATHPFAARISANAVAACAAFRVPLVRFTRPPWRPEPGDRWIAVADLAAASAALGEQPRRIFLTVGRLGLAAFRAAPQHDYLVRTIDPPPHDDLPPRARLILARGPFDAAGEVALMRDHGVEILVSKNSGGEASAGKLQAARTLGVPVVMVAPPPVPGNGEPLYALAAVLAWIDAHRPAP